MGARSGSPRGTAVGTVERRSTGPGPDPSVGPGPSGDSGECPLLVVVVNYKSAGLAVDCLESLGPELEQVPGSRASLVENDSGEGDLLAREVEGRGWGGWVSLERADRNGGFAAGNNRAIVPALASADPPRYVLLLNPDTVVRPGAVRELLAFMDARPDVGIAGSRLEFPDGRAQRSAFRFPSALGELEGGLRLGPATRLLSKWVVAPPVPEGLDPVPTDWVAGASMIVRREVFEAVGPMDEAYFMYFEEVDFCRRAAKLGWPCWYVPRSRVVHLVGQSSGVTDRARARRRRPGYWFESRRRYFRSHHGRAATAVADLLWVVGYCSYRLRRRLAGAPDSDPEHLLRDFVRHSLLPTGPNSP
ncbi:glycosyltransferase family 2 protein [Tautonia plasticadhaerens]|uniref:N-acetylglucosaminyl-diphospho-decaprenol L-rhamnosyltransferase n=1 Tax=Tautonia plasticadhaerens TaxID=2527974 RepID=A0A518HDQ9_9BACT|nr:glycosyltransferase family 2 protein [Tautonia plasticadhaerens]QDV38973.1 N-acetylglucosaminyl-diphospho-decaprenol L-rhamnosyltransferase [Tautonia plasticadhaerens]